MKKFFTLIIILITLAAGTNAQTMTHPMRVGGQIGIAFPIGDASNVYKLGFNINGLFLYNLQPNLDLTGHLGYISLGSKSDVLDYSFSTVPLLVGVRYSFAGGSTLTPYVGAELGLFFSSVKTTVDFGFFGGTQTVSASSTDFGFVPQVGLTYPLTPQLNLDANLKFNLIFTSGASTNLIGINAGVTYGL